MSANSDISAMPENGIHEGAILAALSALATGNYLATAEGSGRITTALQALLDQLCDRATGEMDRVVKLSVQANETDLVNQFDTVQLSRFPHF
jgi:hypothetical protein